MDTTIRWRRGLLDQVGVIASGTCALHCAISALVPGLLVALGLGEVIGHEAEWAFTGMALAFAGFAMVVGWRRHRSFAVMFAFGAGIGGLLVARGMEEAGAPALGTTLALLAGGSLVVAHVSNIRATRACKASGC